MPLVRKPPAPETPQAASSFAGLRSESHEERWAAARTCATTPEGIAALSAAIVTESDERIREAIFTRLALAATPESAAALLPYLRSEDANTRTAALDALKAMPKAAEPHLENLLADPDPDVRLLSCEMVRQLSSTKANDLLCALLDREEHKNVCAAAVDVLAEIGTAKALPTLMRLNTRFSQEPFLLFAIKIASERIGRQADIHE